MIDKFTFKKREDASLFLKNKCISYIIFRVSSVNKEYTSVLMPNYFSLHHRIQSLSCFIYNRRRTQYLVNCRKKGQNRRLCKLACILWTMQELTLDRVRRQIKCHDKGSEIFSIPRRRLITSRIALTCKTVAGAGVRPPYSCIPSAWYLFSISSI